MRSSRWLSAEPTRRLALAGLAAIMVALAAGCANRTGTPVAVSSLTVDAAPLRERGAAPYADAAAELLASAAREVFAPGSGPRVVLVLESIRLASYGEDESVGGNLMSGGWSAGARASRDYASGFLMIDGRRVPMLVNNTVQPSMLVSQEDELRRVGALMRAFASWSSNEVERAAPPATRLTAERSVRP